MKKISILIVSLLLTITIAFPCDICGGGAGSYYLGLLPQFNKKVIGVRYQYNQLFTQLDINGNRTSLTNKEKYNTVEIWGAWNIGTKWRLMAVLPYSYVEKYNYGTDLNTKKNGLSDITVTTYYNIFKSFDNTIKHSVWLGAGIKLPSGKYNEMEVTNNSPNIFQLGTGSTDFLTQVMYDLNINSWGLNTTVNYKINTKNNSEYQYGNKLTANATLYHKINIGPSVRITPNIGINYENQQKDKTMNFTVDQTGGNVLQGSYGIESSIQKIAFGINYQNPLSQNIAKKRADLNNKFMVHLSYAF